jgi:hypothetical protein
VRGGQAFRASARRAHWLPPRWAERPRAYVGAFPIVGHRTLAEVDRDEADVVVLPDAVVVPQRVLKEAKPRIKSGATEGLETPPALPLPAVAVEQPATVGPGPRCVPSPAVVETQESQAKADDEAEGGHASEPSEESVSRPAAGRSAAATSELMDATAGETAPDTFGEVKRRPVPNWQRMAEALRRKDAPAPAAAPVRTKALPVAYDKGPCPRCGIPGFRGCDHQLPYDEAKL